MTFRFFLCILSLPALLIKGLVESKISLIIFQNLHTPEIRHYDRSLPPTPIFGVLMVWNFILFSTTESRVSSVEHPESFVTPNQRWNTQNAKS